MASNYGELKSELSDLLFHQRFIARYDRFTKAFEADANSRLRVLPMEVVIVFGALAIMLAVELFNRRSVFGKAVVATSNDRDAAGLMGINTGLVITFSYALSSLTAAVAGVLVAPVTLTGATMGAVLGLKAFAVAIIGGLNSGLGVVVGGLIAVLAWAF